MLSSLALKFGSAPGRDPLSIDLPPSVTIFVGPNNSGKSQILREIDSFIKTGQNAATNILGSIRFKSIDSASAQAILDAGTVPPALGETVHAAHRTFKGITGIRRLVHEPSFISNLVDPNNPDSTPNFCTWYAGDYVLMIDGPSRIQLVQAQGRGDLKDPQTPFARLFVDDAKRAALRKLIFDATGLQFVLDPSEGDTLNIRYGQLPPPSERSLEDETLEYMRSARSVAQVSDGVKAFTGILLQLHAGKPDIIIVDEPEAFLHPSLAFTLGKEIAKGAAREGKHIFASTHSAKFLMGAISSGATVNIVRLTYDGLNGTARLLANDDLTAMMRDPLLRSVGVLEGLFYNNVVVGEANADRAFYSEVNERLLAKDDARGAPHTLFLNADSKQTVPRVIAPLRKLGIPAAGAVDIDLLKLGGGEWTAQLTAAGIPSKEHSSYQVKRDVVYKALVAAQKKDFKVEGGITILSGEERETAENLLGDLQRYGLFAVPHGEVEHWLAELKVSRSKHGWLREIFEKMGNDPTLPNYVQPTDGDVWNFFGQIADWMRQPTRRGVPL